MLLPFCIHLYVKMSFPKKHSYELYRLKSPDVIRATVGLVVRCWTSNLGNLAGASSNPAKGFHFSNVNEVVYFIFVSVG